MTRNQAQDIRWVAAEVADLAVLLRSHGLGQLANKLTSVQQALQYVPRSRPRTLDQPVASGKVVSLESYRRQSASPSVTIR